MLRFLVRHGAVRMIGGRAVPILMIWDLAMLANRARKIPAVDRGLRRGAAATSRRLATTLEGMARPPSPGRPGSRRRPDRPRQAADPRREPPRS